MRTTLPQSPPSGIALYDFDGTLIAWDCQLLFRHFVISQQPWRACFLPIFLVFLPFAPLLGTERMKRVFLCYLWKINPNTLQRYCDQFAPLIANSIYPELRPTLQAHQDAGHLLVLASASPECYIQAIGDLLGFDISLGTQASFGPLFPPLTNHKGEAKVTRLQQTLPQSYFMADGKLANSHGYTDSTADLPMLAICQSATVVNPSPRLSEIAENSNWTIVRPQRPWQSRIGYAFRAIALLLGIPGNFAGLHRP